MEIRQIPDYPNYTIDEYGRIYNVRCRKYMKLTKTPIGYSVHLSRDGIRFNFYVHRLMFECFYGLLPECIKHIDGNKFNNSLDNLMPVKKSIASVTNFGRNAKDIVKVDIDTQKTKIVKAVNNTILYKVLGESSSQVTHDGALYFYVGEKDKTISKIKRNIYLNTLLIDRLTMDKVIKKVKYHNQNYKKYLQILERA